MLKYKFIESQNIKNLLIELEAIKIVFDSLSVTPEIEENIKRESLLKSALYSARVEGNPATLTSIDQEENLHKLEISNLLTTYKFIYSKNCPKKFSKDLIRNLHKKVMKNISGSAGMFRVEPWAVYNQSGGVVYLAPLHIKIPKMISDLVVLEKKLKFKPVVKSAIIQFLFEKIHPFADGNGRVGRLLSTFVMNVGGYGFRGLVSPEVATDNNRDEYYKALEPNIDLSSFVEFYLQCMISEAKKTIEKLSNKNEILPHEKLALRRREIYEIVKDHPYISFDSLQRRFSKVNSKTLHYDILFLIKENFVIKIGKTRGVTYIINNGR